MKYQHIHLTILVSLSVMLLLSCKKEIEYEGLKGDLKGSVYLYDNEQSITNYSNVTVTAEGSSPLVKAVTNDKGEFTLQGLETGIYDIVFSKEGFATYKIISLQFIGGDTITAGYNPTLYKLPDFSITELKADTFRYIPSYPYFYVNITASVSNKSDYCYLRFYLSDNPKVSYSDYQFTDILMARNGQLLNQLSTDILKTINKYPAGKKMYLIVYPDIAYSNSYLDIITGKQIYGINPDRGSAVVSFTIPKL